MRLNSNLHLYRTLDIGYSENTGLFETKLVLRLLQQLEKAWVGQVAQLHDEPPQLATINRVHDEMPLLHILRQTTEQPTGLLFTVVPTYEDLLEHLGDELMDKETSAHPPELRQRRCRRGMFICQNPRIYRQGKREQKFRSVRWIICRDYERSLSASRIGAVQVRTVSNHICENNG
ncbi:uncharacterized protein LOC131020519 isoform X2 [Salvia miltiorrhiza]|nr:uncharacterized protein LOC131020519 isoform X2 [Salvia miltiorrhiza]